MSSNVGLSTPRGSGTSGYVQRNASLLKPRPQTTAPYTTKPPQSFKPSPQILQHDKLRTLEIQILSLRDALEEQTDPALSEDEIEKQCDELRTKLTEEMEQNKNKGSRKENDGKRMKRYAVHDLAEAKGRESERLRRALGLKKGEGDDEEGGEHPMARQERRRREREEERNRMEIEREEDRDRGRERD